MAKKGEDTVLLFRLRAHKSWVTGPILTGFELDQAFMSVFVTCKLEEAQIKMVENSWRQCFSHYESTRNRFSAQRHVTLKPVVQFFSNSNSVETHWLSSLPATMKDIRSKMTGKSWDTVFHIISQWDLSPFEPEF